MSISSEISRISGNVSDSLDAVAEKGVSVPAGAKSDDLPSLIRSISVGSNIEPATAIPSMDGAGAVGTSSKYAREDHQHPSDTNKVDKAVNIGGSTLLYSQILNNGTNLISSLHSDTTESYIESDGRVGVNIIYADYYDDTITQIGVHRNEITLEASDSNSNYNSIQLTPTQTTITNVVTPVSSNDAVNKAYVDAAVPSDTPLPANTTPQNLGTASIGTATRYARADHVHNLPQQLGSITFGTSWTSYSGYKTQIVTVTGATITVYSKVDLQATAAVFNTLVDAGVSSIYIENNGGTLTAYLVGDAPTSAFTLQCTVTQVKEASA